MKQIKSTGCMVCGSFSLGFYRLTFGYAHKNSLAMHKSSEFLGVGGA
jgi:hypothetical protein